MVAKLRVHVLSALMLLAVGACGEVRQPASTETSKPSQNQITAASGAVRGARYRMRVQLGHTFNQRPVKGERTKIEVSTASPIAR